jgi:hypothetical protein
VLLAVNDFSYEVEKRDALTREICSETKDSSRAMLMGSEVGMSKKLGLTVLMLFMAQASLADSLIAKIRVFAASTTANPKELNDDLAAQNMKDLKSLTKHGVDLSHQINSRWDLGLRYERTGQRSLEITPTPGQNHQATLIQEAIYGVARVNFTKHDNFRADAFVGAGAASTKLNVVSPSQDGYLFTDGYKNFVAKTGASVGVGLTEVFLFLEGGYDFNSVSSGLDRDGNMNGNVGTLDLSGPYVSVGILFEGITGR